MLISKKIIKQYLQERSLAINIVNTCRGFAIDMQIVSHSRSTVCYYMAISFQRIALIFLYICWLKRWNVCFMLIEMPNACSLMKKLYEQSCWLCITQILKLIIKTWPHTTTTNTTSAKTRGNSVDSNTCYTDKTATTTATQQVVRTYLVCGLSTLIIYFRSVEKRFCHLWNPGKTCRRHDCSGVSVLYMYT